MITLIGTRCKHSNVLSRGVLISRFLLGNVKTTKACKVSPYRIREGEILHTVKNSYFIQNKLES